MRRGELGKCLVRVLWAWRWEVWRDFGLGNGGVGVGSCSGFGVVAGFGAGS